MTAIVDHIEAVTEKFPGRFDNLWEFVYVPDQNDEVQLANLRKADGAVELVYNKEAVTDELWPGVLAFLSMMHSSGTFDRAIENDLCEKTHLNLAFQCKAIPELKELGFDFLEAAELGNLVPDSKNKTTEEIYQELCEREEVEYD
jgi:hypothetical protein